MTPLDTSCEAEYTDGYIHSETELNDISPYDDTKNILNDILNKRPEAEHGRMVRFSVFYKDARHDVDWTDLPENARPIRFRDAHLERNIDTGQETFSWLGVRFGYQYNKSGKNIKEIKELK